MKRAAKEGGVSLSASRALNRSIESCRAMFAMLKDYASLGKPVIVVENGIRVTKCPPAYARGVYPQRNVGAKT
jgi:hypothetical protein